MPITDAEVAELSERGYLPLLKKTVTLTDAQIKTLPTTGVEIVPAPGAGKALLFLRGLAIVDVQAGGYTNISTPSSLHIVSALTPGSSTTGVSAPAEIEWMLDDDSEVNAVWFMPRTRSDNNTQSRTDTWDDGDSYENAPFLILMGNADGDLTGGNAANSIKVTVVYTIVDVS